MILGISGAFGVSPFFIAFFIAFLHFYFTCGINNNTQAVQ